MKAPSRNGVSPTDFMRARRPELYSDSIVEEELPIDRNQFEFHLDTLTQRKEEIRFEQFCRRLAQKQICPNLLPQTGPTGGGDSKVDTETYPVSEVISDRWYVGDPKRASNERWAFAISAKKDWRSKIADDVQKIIDTNRPYSLVYFITNQAVRDKARAEVEDALLKKHGVAVRILDRTWIVETVHEHKRWDIVYQTLDIDSPKATRRLIAGPLDAERERDLADLDSAISDPERYQPQEYQLVEDCLQAALLARGLARSREEIDGRFDRAERLARKRNDRRQLFHILYQRAWTANWWFDDFDELDKIYQQMEPFALESEWIWDLEKLVNLWQAQEPWRYASESGEVDESWREATGRLRGALAKHAIYASKPTSALWARTQLLLMDLTDASRDRDQLPTVLNGFAALLKEVEGHLDYPVEPVIKIVRELGTIMGDDETYDDLIEAAIQFQAKRTGKMEQGRMRLERGSQKLKSGKTYDAIDQFCKAQTLLRGEETRAAYIHAGIGAALGYESAGLLWAARANLVMALDRTLYKQFKEGDIDPLAPTILRKLVWVELQLGRVPCVLAWIEWLRLIATALKLDADASDKLQEEVFLMDAVLGILILRTRFDDWRHLESLPSLLDQMALFLARGASLFSLGYEEKFREEHEDPDGDLNLLFSQWLEQPAASDLPKEASWHVGSSSSMRTVILGCEIEVFVRNTFTTILLGEAILAFLESFFSTAVRVAGHHSARPYLRIEIEQSETADAPFSHRLIEDECGETTIVIAHAALQITELIQHAGYQESLFRLLGQVAAQLHAPFLVEFLEQLFSEDRAHDRAYFSAHVPIAVNNIMGDDPKYRLDGWDKGAALEKLTLCRAHAWKPQAKPIPAAARDSTAIEAEPPPPGLFGIDSLKHSQMLVHSPINMVLWDKAKWRGLGVLSGGAAPFPGLVLAFEDLEAGRKIFRGWHKKLGSVDHEEWIGLTIILGTNRLNPFQYRVVVSVGDEYIKRLTANNQRFAQVFRMQDMMPTNSNNLDRFLYEYGRAGRYSLEPSGFNRSQLIMHAETPEVVIEKRKIRVLSAWEIAPTDIASMSLGGISDPLIPSDVIDPPILKTLRHLEELRVRHNAGVPKP